MVFLIQYDRKRGSMVLFRVFEDAVREHAENERLALEVELQTAGIENEVVLLEAPSEEALRRTHRRYFESLWEFAQTPPSASVVRERPTRKDSAD